MTSCADAVIFVLWLAAEIIFEMCICHGRRRARAEEQIYRREILHVVCYYDCKRKIFLVVQNIFHLKSGRTRIFNSLLLVGRPLDSMWGAYSAPTPPKQGARPCTTPLPLRESGFLRWRGKHYICLERFEGGGMSKDNQLRISPPGRIDLSSRLCKS